MKRGLRVLLFSDGFINLSLGMIGPIYALFVQQIGGDLLDASWAFFTYMITAGVVMYFIGRWENRFKHKEKLVIAGYLLTNLGCLSYIFVFNQVTLLITQGILGIAMAILSPAFDSTYAHYVTRKRETSDWGTWEAMSYIVTAFAALIGGLIAENFGFRILFVAMFIISIISTIESLKLLASEKKLNNS